MLTIKIQPEPNGARANQTTSENTAPQDGWIEVPAALEAKALTLLPWLKITMEGGTITAVEDDVEAREVWETANPPMPPEPTTEETLLELTADQEYRLCLIELGLN